MKPSISLIFCCSVLMVSALSHGVDDSDGDGLSDAWELAYGFDPMGTDESALDPDTDGLSNLQEFNHELNPLVSNSGVDSDGDSLSDDDEILSYGTHPLTRDSDNDGIPDDWELNAGLDPMDRSDAVVDSEGDGLVNIAEYQLGTDPSLSDSDSDGVNDSNDDLPTDPADSVDTDGDGIGNSTDSDDDGDGIDDTVESSNCIYGQKGKDCTNPLLADSDGDTISDDIEIANGTNPVGHITKGPWMIGDADHDQIQDDWESLHGVDDPAADPDGDGITNLSEYQNKTDPNSVDSDGDGYTDDWEVANNTDPASGADTIQMVMATGQSLSVGGGFLFPYPDPYDPASERTITKEPDYNNCPYGFCLMFNSGTRGTGVLPVNTVELPLTHLESLMEGSATFGPSSCNSNPMSPNYCEPREVQGSGMLTMLYTLFDNAPGESPTPYLYRSHGAGSQPYDPTRSVGYDPAEDPDHLLGLKKGSQAYQNAFDSVDGELKAAMQMAADPALTPWAAGVESQARNINVAAVTITHGEKDRSSNYNNQQYDNDLREWIADYSNEIMAKTGQQVEPVFLVDQLSTFPFGGAGHKIQIDQFRVTEELPNAYLSTPKYQLPFLDDGLHLTAEGYHLLGEYQAKVLKQVQAGVDWKPLHPQSSVLSGNTIDISFYVPEGSSIVLDIAACNRMTGSAGQYDNLYGFQYREGQYSQSNPAIKIQNVEVVGDDVVRVTLNGSPNASDFPRIHYAYDSSDNMNCGALRDDFVGQQVSTLAPGSDNFGRVLHNWAITFDAPTDGDMDGMPDGWELLYGFNPQVDDSALDADGDGLSNSDEYHYGGMPNTADSDGDGITDGDEVHVYGTSPATIDSDDDGFSDWDEINVHFTDPIDRDSDDDGVNDPVDAFPNDPTETLDTDGDGIGNNADTDDDNDTVPDVSDACPLDALGSILDTDGDGLCDEGADTDDDNDGMPDSWEATYGLNPVDAADANSDLDGDGFSNLIEYERGTDPTIYDGSVYDDYTRDGISGWIWRGTFGVEAGKSLAWSLDWNNVSGNWVSPSTHYLPDFDVAQEWDIETTGDFDGDGDADWLWRNKTDARWKVWIIEDGNRASQNNSTIFDAAHDWNAIGAGDTDRDGDDDVILHNPSTGQIIIWEMQNHVVATAHAIGTKAGYDVVRIGDYDADGDVDLLLQIQGGNALRFWEIENNSWVQEHSTQQTGSDFSTACSGDFDGDGDDDIFLTAANGTIKYFEIEDFVRQAQHFGANQSGWLLHDCGDYDGDGTTDTHWTSDDGLGVNRFLIIDSYVTESTFLTNAFAGTDPASPGYGFEHRSNRN